MSFSRLASKLLTLPTILICTLFLPAKNTTAQVVAWSTYLNTTATDNIVKMVNDDAGNIYVLGSSQGEGYPVTVGATQSSLGGSQSMLVISKLSANGKLLWSTYYGGDEAQIQPSGLHWDAASNTISATAYTLANNYPVVNGKPKAAGSKGSSVLTQFDANTGNPIYSTHVFSTEINISFGGFRGAKAVFENGFAYLSAVSLDKKKYVVSKINLSSHSIVYETSIGGSNGSFFIDYGAQSTTPTVVQNGEFYMAAINTATDYPVTPGAYQASYPANANWAYVITKLTANGNIAFSTYAHKSPDDIVLFPQLAVSGQELAFAAGFENGLPVSPAAVAFNDIEANNMGLIKLNSSTGSLRYATYLGPSSGTLSLLANLNYVGNSLVINGFTKNAALPVTRNAQQPRFAQGADFASDQDMFIAHIDGNNQLVYCSYWGGSNIENFFGAAVVSGSDIYLIRTTNSNNFPVTPNATQPSYGGNSDAVIVKFSTAKNAITYSSYLGTDLNDFIDIAPVAMPDGTLYLSTYFSPVWMGPQTISKDFPSTPDALRRSVVGSGTGQQYLAKINTNTGKLLYGSYIGRLPGASSIGERTVALLVKDDDAYLAGYTFSGGYPVTQGAIRENYLGGSDIYVTKLDFCGGSLANNTLNPTNQAVCANGLADSIYGSRPQLANTPVIFRNNQQQTQQSQVVCTYRWQQSLNGHDWENLDGINTKDYLPQPTDIKKYYRRIASSTCGQTDTSAPAIVNITSPAASKPEAGGDNGNIFTCPGNNAALGATAVNGLSYSWQPAGNLTASNIAKPSFSSNQPGIYTYVLYATNAAGCTGMDTVRIFNYKANAGADKILCPGKPSQIGGTPLAGLPNISYQWEPATGLSCSNCAQPLASQPGTYRLSVKMPLAGGGECVTSDEVVVISVALPTQPAGPDLALCNNTIASLGTAAIPGFTYNWSPGLFLSGIAGQSNPVFNEGKASIHPAYNPIEYVATVINPSGCSVVDTAKVYVLDVFAGYSGCRPLQLGKRDFTNGEAKYEWVDISNGTEQPIGPGELSATNIPNPMALAKSDITYKIYRLKMTWQGVTCHSDIAVGANCGCPSFNIKNNSPAGCAIASASDSLTLYIDAPAYGYTYTWSPADGLSSTKGSSVKTGTDTAITYTVTATNDLGTSVFCIQKIDVNPVSTAVPDFDAPDSTVCPGVGINIGLPATAGWSYQWTSSETGENIISTEANPMMFPTRTTTYRVTVTDVQTGCFTKDEVTITVPFLVADVGPDRPFCGTGGFTIGTPAITGLTYRWIPANGLNNAFIAQPTVQSADVSTTYVLLVTDPVSGCRIGDVLNLNHSSTPTLIPMVAPAPYCASPFADSVQIGYTETASGASYQWSPTIGLANATAAITAAKPLCTTTYVLTVSFPGCAQPASQEVTVTVNPLPSVAITQDAQCAGTQLQVNTNALLPSYSWLPGTGLSSITESNPVATVAETTQYEVLVTDGATHCNNKGEVTVTPLVFANAGTDKTVCAGSSVQLGVAAQTGTVYSWLPANELDDAAKAQPIFTPTTAGMHELILSATINGCTRKDTMVVWVNEAPVVNAAAAVSICANGRVQIGTAPLPGYSYSWSPASNLSDATIANPFASPSVATNYTLTATNNVTGCTASAVTNVAINNEGAPVVSVSGSSICPGNIAQLNATVAPSGNYSYAWATDRSFITSTFINNPKVSPQETTDYQVLVTNMATGCSNIATATVIVKDSCGITPVSWLNFTATAKNGVVLLQWQVAMEQNNREFTIERSADGNSWRSIGTIPSKGNSSQPRSYNATDATAIVGTVYYRIRQTDIDGSSRWSVIRSVSQQPALKFEVYPNPTSQFVYYQYHGAAGSKVCIQLYSITGKLVRQWKLLGNKNRLDLSILPAGTYLIALTDDEGNTEFRKIVIQ